jgi:futalosine hydrolase
MDMIAQRSNERNRSTRILIVTAVDAERDAVLNGMRGLDIAERIDVIAAGVGPVAAAIGTMKRLSEHSYDLVINCGIAGGFPGYAEVGSTVLATEIIAADLGAETPDGFSSMDELGFGSTSITVAPDLLVPIVECLRSLHVTVQTGPVLTVSTVTGTAQTAKDRAERTKGALAEGMEGFGVAMAAQAYRLPVLEIRTISNAVGLRDRNQWKIKEALLALTKVGQAVAEVERWESQNHE